MVKVKKKILLSLLGIAVSFSIQAKVQYGMASFYHNKFNGRLTANGERFHNSKMSAAHKTLPFGTRVRVTNLSNGKSLIVRINDRGPYVKHRIIDLSRTAFKRIESEGKGLARVKVEVIHSPKTK